MRRTRFQQGSLQIVKRAGGRKAWEYRWYELQADGSRTRRNLMVGSLEQYPNETAAQKAVAALRADINAESPRTSLTPISVQTLVEHYREKELGPDCTKTRKTQVTYIGYFRKWILPRWGSYQVTEVKAVAVEQWLRSLKYANGSKAKARNIMSAVFNTRLPTQMDWLCTVEFIPEDNGEARLFATEIIGHLFGYSEATNTRALVADADANAYELVFSFASSENRCPSI